RQPEPSTKPPWTSTTFCTSVIGDLLVVGRPRTRSTWWSATLTAFPHRGVRQMTTLLGRLLTYVAGTRRRRQRGAQLRARRDPELRERPVQVGADRAMREKQALADLAVRQA